MTILRIIWSFKKMGQLGPPKAPILSLEKQYIF